MDPKFCGCLGDIANGVEPRCDRRSVLGGVLTVVGQHGNHTGMLQPRFPSEFIVEVGKEHASVYVSQSCDRW